MKIHGIRGTSLFVVCCLLFVVCCLLFPVFGGPLHATHPWQRQAPHIQHTLGKDSPPPADAREIAIVVRQMLDRF